MGDKIGLEDEAAVEQSPAPPQPRPDSAAKSPREPAGASPRRAAFDVDDYIEKQIRKGPGNVKADKCGKCHGPWHGLYDKERRCPGEQRWMQ